MTPAVSSVVANICGRLQLLHLTLGRFFCKCARFKREDSGARNPWAELEIYCAAAYSLAIRCVTVDNVTLHIVYLQDVSDDENFCTVDLASNLIDYCL